MREQAINYRVLKEAVSNLPAAGRGREARSEAALPPDAGKNLETLIRT